MPDLEVENGEEEEEDDLGEEEEGENVVVMEAGLYKVLCRVPSNLINLIMRFL